MRVKDAKQDLASGKFTEISEAAEAHGLARSTLQDRLRGGVSCREARVLQQNLTPAEEDAIKHWILRLNVWGFPPHHQYVHNLARQFLQSHGITAPILGKNRITRFLSPHPELASKFCHRLDKQPSFVNNPIILKDFFIKVFYIYWEYY